MVTGPYYPITGIRAGVGHHGEVPVRMEVDEWWSSKRPIHISQHSLALQALTIMYETDPHDKLSYYQIAGIHNQPIVPWDGAPFENKNYCTHSSPNFPTWHRPYVALLEQRMYEIMLSEIIPKFPPEEQDDLKKAANVWRFPFWDWATKKKQEDGSPANYDVPKIAVQSHVEVRTPEGSEKIKNPFYKFDMKDDVNMGDEKLKPDVVTREPFVRTSGTSRHGYPDGSKEDVAYRNFQEADGIVNNDGVQDELQEWKWEAGGNLTGSLRDWFYRVLLQTPYPAFATKRPETGQVSDRYSALEDIHDVLHDWGGGTFGHMGAPAIGAMDPLFWLHHCQVDRALELWAALHPQESREWLEKDPDAEQKLIPFRSNQYGGFLTSRDIWSPEALGYTYPETKRWIPEHQTDGKFDEKKLAAEIAKVLEKKYNSAASAAVKSHATKPRPPGTNKHIGHPDVAKTQATKLTDQISGGDLPGAAISVVEKGKELVDHIPDVITQHDYVANIAYEKYALNGHPFTIRIYIGPVPEEGSFKDIKGAQTQVGEIYAFVDPVEFDKGQCANCAQQKRDAILNTGQVPLTNALLTRHKQQIPHKSDKGETHLLKSLDPEDVVPFLAENFHWKVTDREGGLVDPKDIGSLKVSVAVGTAEHFKDMGKLSNFKDYKILYDITANDKSGTGAKKEDNLFPHQSALTAAEGLALKNPVVKDVVKEAEGVSKAAGDNAGKAANSVSQGLSSAAAGLGLGGKK